MAEVQITLDTRKVERIIYIVIILILAFLLWKKPFGGDAGPSCTDAAQNQDETAPDCGGPCGGAWNGTACVREDGTIPQT